jgi:hypothetical protein
MRWILSLVLCALISGCIAKQPDSQKTVAAFEVPLRSEADRQQFISILRAAAEAQSMHVDVESNEDLARDTNASPLLAKTLNLAVWQGVNDDAPVASAMDQSDHLGLVWVMFARGDNTQLATKFRESAVRKIMELWPETSTLPVMPNGSIPLHSDLIRTANGYKVKPSEAHKYTNPY